MPTSVILANILIVMSGLFPFIDSYYYGIDGFDKLEAPYELWAIDLLWLFFIFWIIWRMTKGVDWRPGILAISGVTLALAMVDVFEYGLMANQLMYLLEAMFLFFAWWLLRDDFSSICFSSVNKE